MNLDLSLTNKTTNKNITSEIDIDIIKRILDGNVDAFEIIMRRYNQRLYRIARGILKDDHEAIDVVQETYVKAYYQLKNFNGPDGFASWLSRIASNEALMRIRKSNRIDYTLDDPMYHGYTEPTLDIQPTDSLAIGQLRELLENAIEQLNIDNRCVYVMRAIQQLSTHETAQSLGVTEDVVKTRYLRAKRSLQKIFEGHIEKAGLNLYEFAGKRCDLIVLAVMKKLYSS